jgi:Transposase and inactivated derivatives, IS30 family
VPRQVPDTRRSHARGPVTDAERARVAELHAAGESRAAIARELKRSPTTIGRIGAGLGLSWDGSKTAAATARKQIDNKARRALLIARAYDQAEAILDRLDAKDGYDATGTATNGTTVVTRVSSPPTRDVKDLAGAFSTFTGSAARMEAQDADTGAAGARSVLGQLAAGLQLAAEQIDGTTDPEGGAV